MGLPLRRERLARTQPRVLGFPFAVTSDSMGRAGLPFTPMKLRSICFVFLSGLFAMGAAWSPRAVGAEPIDRRVVVNRHDVRVTSVDPESALSVGNGDFAFTVDVTGLQSFGELYFEKGLLRSEEHTSELQ